MSFRFERPGTAKDEDVYFEIDLVVDPGGSGKTSLLIKHQLIKQETDFKQFFTGTPSEVRDTFYTLVMNRKKYGYIPADELSQQLANTLGWKDWCKTSEESEEG